MACDSTGPCLGGLLSFRGIGSCSLAFWINHSLMPKWDFPCQAPSPRPRVFPPLPQSSSLGGPVMWREGWGSSPPQKSRAQGQRTAADASSHMTRGPGQGQAFGGVSERKASLPRKGKRVPMTPGVIRLRISWRTGRLRILAALGSFLLRPVVCCSWE